MMTSDGSVELYHGDLIAVKTDGVGAQKTVLQLNEACANDQRHRYDELQADEHEPEPPPAG